MEMKSCDIVDKYLEKSIDVFKKFKNLEHLVLNLEYDDSMGDESLSLEEEDEKEN